MKKKCQPKLGFKLGFSINQSAVLCTQFFSEQEMVTIVSFNKKISHKPKHKIRKIYNKKEKLNNKTTIKLNNKAGVKGVQNKIK